MELTQHDILEEMSRETIGIPFSGCADFFHAAHHWNFSSFMDYAATVESLDSSSSSSAFQDFLSTSCPLVGTEFIEDDPLSIPIPELESLAPHLWFQEPYSSLVKDEELVNFDDGGGTFKLGNSSVGEGIADPTVVVVYNAGERKGRSSKKVVGQPSKNLMAERRRRKRLNDRLSMLRSIVPKISKMDRTSILGDTIDYMKELLERIERLQGGGVGVEEMKSSGAVRNSPKFDVERRDVDTRVEVCCAPKPGLLLSTVSTLETLGLEIQQCVISCFSDFSMLASCSEVSEESITCDERKQALVRNAGYGGRCF